MRLQRRRKGWFDGDGLACGVRSCMSRDITVTVLRAPGPSKVSQPGRRSKRRSRSLHQNARKPITANRRRKGFIILSKKHEDEAWITERAVCTNLLTPVSNPLATGVRTLNIAETCSDSNWTPCLHTLPLHSPRSSFRVASYLLAIDVCHLRNTAADWR